MRFTADAGKAILSAALVVVLGGCSSLAKPGEALWPYGSVPGQQPAFPGQAAATEGPEGLYVSQETVEGRQVSVIGNRGNRDLTVVYETGTGSYQTVQVPAGGSVPVAEPVQRIVEAR